MTNLNELAKEIHANAIEKGWWETERELPEILMLCVSELSEALEEYRAGRPMFFYPCWRSDVDFCVPDEDCEYENLSLCTHGRAEAEQGKPEGIAVELADCMIRILDYCAYAGIDIENTIRFKHEYNKTRPYRHGGKRA